jgi:histidine ammonia-lyase
MIYYDQELSLQEIESLLFTNEKIALSPKAEKRVESSYQFLKEFSQGKVIYGINTGFGPMAQYRVSDETLSSFNTI